ncbi:ABC transporter substrate-binding protein [Lacrimispora sp.]|uniref:ABC transporter substrate-binding protein n=1 Tax=Lacrimispora sp. TaxID=2719234 RepID=UPI0028A59B48|nr:extracellular solute-binding protein [Lacrimispora sp.]
MKKKVLGVGLGTMLMALTLVGCSLASQTAEQSNKAEGGAAGSIGGNGKEASADGKVELEFFNCKVEGEAVFNKVIEKFEEEYPNVVIKQTAPADAETVLFTRVSTGDVPDIMSVYPAETAYHTMMDDGVYTELTNEEWLNRASDSALQFSTWNGKIYAMPFALNSFGIYCNRTMFEEAGLKLPATWSELMAVCEAFQSKGITPFTFVDKDPGYLAQEGERIVGIIKNDVYTDTENVGTTQASFGDEDKPYFKELAQAMLKTREYAGDTLSYGIEQCVADFANGKIPMFIAITAKYTVIQQNNPDLNFTLIPYPSPVSDDYKTPINVDIAYGVSSKTSHQKEAKAFIEFLSRPEIYQMVADEEGTPPVIKGVNYNIEPLKSIKEVIDSGNTFLTMVNFWPSGWRSEWSVYVQQLISDKNTDNFLKETDRICKEKYASQ